MASKIKVDQIQTIDGSGTIALQNQLSGMTSASMPTGSVLQVVNASSTTEMNSQTTTMADTGLTASITPSSTSNYILVSVSHTGLAKYSGSAADTRLKITLLRGSSQIALIAARAGWTNSTTYHWFGGTGITFKDTPASTSALTYKTQFSRSAGDGVVRISDDNTLATITLMEIKG